MVEEADRIDARKRVQQLLLRPYARFFGFELLDVRPGEVALSLSHRAAFEHAKGWFQGTITSAIGEMAASYSGVITSKADWIHATIEQSIHFTGAARGEKLLAFGRVVKRGRSISFTAADIFVEFRGERKMCAHLNMTMRHVPPKS